MSAFAEENAKLLLHELSNEPPNILRIRRLCRENPGLVAVSGFRNRIWSLLLLGGSLSLKESERFSPSEIDCAEQHVLENDVKRTRSEIPDFRSTAYREALTDIMQLFCVVHDIQYKQGMNELVAPFLYLHPPPKGNALPFTLYEAFLFRYLERYFCLDDSSFLFKAFRLFHILLLYHDPQLALHLDEHGIRCPRIICNIRIFINFIIVNDILSPIKTFVVYLQSFLPITPL